MEGTEAAQVKVMIIKNASAHTLEDQINTRLAKEKITWDRVKDWDMLTYTSKGVDFIFVTIFYV